MLPPYAAALRHHCRVRRFVCTSCFPALDAIFLCSNSRCVGCIPPGDSTCTASSDCCGAVECGIDCKSYVGCALMHDMDVSCSNSHSSLCHNTPLVARRGKCCKSSGAVCMDNKECCASADLTCSTIGGIGEKKCCVPDTGSCVANDQCCTAGHICNMCVALILPLARLSVLC